MRELISAVENWADQRGLIKNDRETILAQLGKTLEELGETSGAILKNRPNDIMDGIGDTVVCLIILAAQHGLRIEECLSAAYDEIKNRHGQTIGGTFIKEEPIPAKDLKCNVCTKFIHECLCG